LAATSRRGRWVLTSSLVARRSSLVARPDPLTCATRSFVRQVLNNYAHIFDLLIRLRQAANHPYLVIFSKTASGNGATNVDNALTGGATPHTGATTATTTATTTNCGLCRDSVEDDPCQATCCNALYCRACAMDLANEGMQAQAATLCAVCDKPLCLDLSGRLSDKSKRESATPRAKAQSILSRIDLSKFESSTKIEALREELFDMLENSPSAKAIVFSQFTSMLDLIHYRLEQCGIRCITLHGGMSLKQREKAISAFQDDPGITVFLMSLKGTDGCGIHPFRPLHVFTHPPARSTAGGVALNLTCASHAFIMVRTGCLGTLSTRRTRRSLVVVTLARSFSGSVVEFGDAVPGDGPDPPPGSVQADAMRQVCDRGIDRRAHPEAAGEEGGGLRGDGRQRCDVGALVVGGRFQVSLQVR